MPEVPAFGVNSGLSGTTPGVGKSPQSGKSQTHVQSHCAPNGPSNFPTDPSAVNANPSLQNKP